MPKLSVSIGVLTFFAIVSSHPQSEYARPLTSSEQQERYQQRERQLRYEQYKEQIMRKEQQRSQSRSNDERERDVSDDIQSYKEADPPQKQVLRYRKPEPESAQAKGSTWNLELNLPDLLKNIFGFENSLRTNPEDNQKFKIEVMTPDVHTIMKTLEEMMRRTYDPAFSYVEEAPGTYKSPSVVYPPNFTRNNLQKLLRIKERMNMKKRELNEGKEFY